MSEDRLIVTISKYEDLALKHGMLTIAIKLNWLRNAVRFDGFNAEAACEILFNFVIAGRFGLVGE